MLLEGGKTRCEASDAPGEAGAALCSWSRITIACDATIAF